MIGHSTIDALAHAVASRASRRGLAVCLAGGVLSALLLARDPADVSAKPCPPCRKKHRGRCKRKRPDGVSCGECRECQGGQCDPLPLGTSCGMGKSCQGGICADCDPGNASCTPGSSNTCCSGKCSQAQPNLYQCEPHGAPERT